MKLVNLHRTEAIKVLQEFTIFFPFVFSVLTFTLAHRKGIKYTHDADIGVIFILFDHQKMDE